MNKNTARNFSLLIIFPLLFLFVSVPAAAENDIPVSVEAAFRDLGARITREGVLEGVTFTLWKREGERLMVKAGRVEFKNERVGFFYSAANRALALDDVKIVFEREGHALITVAAAKAEVRMAGGRLEISEGARVDILGTTRQVGELTWNLSGRELLLDGIPLTGEISSAIWS